MNTELCWKQDADARESIVREPCCNFFVEAGAGSGKTTMLVRRMVAMVEAGIDVSRICAITFTRAAAGEFFDRFQKLLAERSAAVTEDSFLPEPGELGAPNEITRSRCLEALQNIDLCFTGTIDSFCNMILSEHPADAGIPSGAVVLQEEDTAAVWTREYSRILKGEYGAVLKESGECFSRLHGTNAKSVFLAGMNSVMEIRHTDIVLPECPDSPASALAEVKKGLLSVLDAMLRDRAVAAYPGDQANQAAWANLEDNADTLKGDWEKDAVRVAYALAGLKKLRLTVDWYEAQESRLMGLCSLFQGHYGKSKARPSWYEVNADWLNSQIAAIRDYLTANSMEFLCDAAQAIAEECRRHGKLTYFDYLLYLRDLLKKDAGEGGKLIRHIYSRHSYFLIDEFQDTNPMQAEIFFYLTAAVPQTDWTKCIPQPGSLFIVGDPKQSIYRFRGADVASFLRVRALFTGDVGRVLSLTRNFRSTRHLRSWFNTVFRGMLYEETADQSRFEEIPLEESPEEDGMFGGVYSIPVPVNSSRGLPEEQKAPGVIAAAIREMVGNPAFLLPHGSGNDLHPEPVAYRDIMLITPTKDALQKYMKAFARAGIPFTVDGKTQFGECPALCELEKLFSVIAAPNDVHALYRALTGRVLGFHWTRLVNCRNLSATCDDGTTVRFRTRIFADNSAFTKENGFPDAEPLKDALQKLGGLTREAYGMSSAALFRSILDFFPVFEKASTENLEYVWFALELLRAGELDGSVASLAEGAAFLKNLTGNTSGLERCIRLTPENDRVRLANLHKVKGLEAPVVILANPERRSHTPSRRTEQCGLQPRSWIFRIPNPNSFNAPPFLETKAFLNEEVLEQQSGDAEDLRLLYVAATRAKNVLLVTEAFTSKKDPAASNMWLPFADEADGLFSDLPCDTPAEEPERSSVPIAELSGLPGGKNPLQTSSVQKSHEICRPSTLLKVTGISETEEAASETKAAEAESGKEPKAGGRRDGALIGTMVHRVLEVLVSSGNRADAEALAKETVSEYCYGDPARKAGYESMLTRVIETVRNGGYPQSFGAPQDILTELLNAEERFCEVPFCYREDPEKAPFLVWNGVIDVLYRKGDVWHIIDYKTNAEEDGLETEYESQLNAYVRALKETEGIEADAKLYHIDVDL